MDASDATEDTLRLSSSPISPDDDDGAPAFGVIFARSGSVLGDVESRQPIDEATSRRPESSALESHREDAPRGHWTETGDQECDGCFKHAAGHGPCCQSFLGAMSRFFGQPVGQLGRVALNCHTDLVILESQTPKLVDAALRPRAGIEHRDQRGPIPTDQTPASFRVSAA